jgi:hypothetical protein
MVCGGGRWALPVLLTVPLTSVAVDMTANSRLGKLVRGGSS